MKKLILLAAMGAVAVGANAQYKTAFGTLMTAPKDHKQIKVRGALQPTNTANSTTANKSTGGSRWYNYADAQGAYASLGAATVNMYDTMHASFGAMWQDSTVMYTGSTDGIDWLSVGQIFHPQSPIYNDPALSVNANMLQVDDSKPYSIDSFYIRGAYSRKFNTYTDTMILTFIYEDSSGSVGNVAQFAFFSYGGTVQADHNLDSFSAQLYDLSSYQTMPINQVAYGSNGLYLKGKQVKVPLTAATAADTMSDGTTDIKCAVGINMLPGTKMGVTATFKSGTSYTANTPIDNYNYFAFLSHETSPGGFLLYPTGDFNMSSVFYKDSSNSTVNTTLGIYIPDLAWTAPFQYEAHNMGWKVTCASCYNVGVNDVPTNTVSVNAVPNPANTSVTVSVGVKQPAASTTVSIINTLGQTVKMQDLGKVNQSAKATFSTSDLASGIYIYSVVADGQRTTGRIVVAH